MSLCFAPEISSSLIAALLDARVWQVGGDVGQVALPHLSHLAQAPQLAARHLLVDVLLPRAAPHDLAAAADLEPLRDRLHMRTHIVGSRVCCF